VWVLLSGSKDIFVFPKGTITVVHHKVGKDTMRFDKITCYGTFAEHGTYTVAHGSGAYASVHGHGSYRVTAKFVGCSQNKPPRLFFQDIEASGRLSL
jgi:hypothetical protein